MHEMCLLANYMLVVDYVNATDLQVKSHILCVRITWQCGRVWECGSFILRSKVRIMLAEFDTNSAGKSAVVILPGLQ